MMCPAHRDKEIILKGLPIVSGVGAGKALVAGFSGSRLRSSTVSESQVGHEILRFEKVREEAKALYRQKLRGSGSESGDILRIFVHMVDDPVFTGSVTDAVVKKFMCLEDAIRSVATEISRQMSLLKTLYFKERASDILEIGEVLLGIAQEQHTGKDLSDPVILIIPRTLIPSDFLFLDKAKIKGIAALNAGTTSHAVILARTLSIPLVSKLKGLSTKISQGQDLLIDGSTGRLYINPLPVRSELAVSGNTSAQLLSSIAAGNLGPAVTLDGRDIEVGANTALPEDVDLSLRCGADCIGLVRSEFLFLKSAGMPGLAEQRSHFDQFFTRAGGKIVNIRLVDIGGDKTPSYMKMPREHNPFMGWRGVRVLLKKPEMFETHLTAIMQSARGRPYRILAPMVATIGEWRQTRNFIEKTAAKIGLPVPECGLMIEIPLALLEIGSFLEESDFVSIGTNDLMQFLLAADRSNPNVNYLHNPVDLVFLNLLRTAFNRAESSGRPLSVCGEMASFPLYTPLLIGMGLRKFSVIPTHIPIIKDIIRKISHEDAVYRTVRMFSITSYAEMVRQLELWNRQILGNERYDVLQQYFVPCGT